VSFHKENATELKSVDFIYLIFLLRPRRDAKYCDAYVSLSVTSVRSHNSKTTRQSSPIFQFVAYGRGPVLLWRRCDTLCTSSLWMSSFVSHNGPMARHVYSQAAIEYGKHNSRDSNQILRNDKD